jgi:hypothetical protein
MDYLPFYDLWQQVHSRLTILNNVRDERLKEVRAKWKQTKLDLKKKFKKDLKKWMYKSISKNKTNLKTIRAIKKKTSISDEIGQISSTATIPSKPKKKTQTQTILRRKDLRS